ncbi:MAG: T9SS type A sorting domain-containing protein, partial [Rhabdochlamydiaceae bacterium]
VTAAFQKWISLCHAGTLNISEDASGSSGCCIPIVYWSDPNEFPAGDEGTLAETNPVWQCGDPEVQGALICEFDATNPNHHMWIHINHSSTAKDVIQDVYPCPPASNCKVPNGKTQVNLCNVLSHEIGHVFGMMHTVEVDPKTGQDGPNCGSYSDDDLMAWAGTQGTACAPPNWTLNDMCMFQKLYCYGYPLLSVNPTTILSMNPDLEVHPNPTTGILTIQFSADVSGSVHVALIDILGNTILNNSFRCFAGRETKTLDLSKLPANYYIVRIEGPDFRASHLIRVAR